MWAGALLLATTLTDADCLGCHEDQKALATSWHAPVACTACHSDVTEVPHETRIADATSPVARRAVSQTCGTCHQDEQAAYDQSVHGRAVARGAGGAPVCTDCHGD